MDKTSRRVLKFIREHGGRWSYLNGGLYTLAQTLNLSIDDLSACLRFLRKDGLIEDSITNSGFVVGIALTHEGRNLTAFKRLKIRRFLLNNCIAILALIVSIIALLRP